jgi:hypothetical protein
LGSTRIFFKKSNWAVILSSKPIQPSAFIQVKVTPRNSQRLCSLQSPETGFHFSSLDGGFKCAQIPMQSSALETIFSGQLLSSSPSIIAMVVMDRSPLQHKHTVEQALQTVNLGPAILSNLSLHYIETNLHSASLKSLNTKDPLQHIKSQGRKDSAKVWRLLEADGHIFQLRLSFSTRFTILRPGFWLLPR